MQIGRGFRPVALAIAALSIPVMAFAQDMMMGPLGTRDNPEHGTILTNAEGRTVYSWQGDTAGAGTSNCNDQCAGAWPPVTISQDMMMSSGMSMDMMMTMSGLGAIQRADGTVQATWNGWPLYYFQRDMQPGDVTGHGSNGFGNRWEVVPAPAM